MVTIEDVQKAAAKLCTNDVVAQLKDPGSSQFRNVTASLKPGETSKWTVSGEVNSKNSLGGYVGFHQFMCDANTGTGQASGTYIAGG